jgi:RecJ-like exonuclease
MLCYVTFVKKTEKLYFHSAISERGHLLFKHNKEFNPGAWLYIDGEEKRIDEDTIEIIPSSISIAVKPKQNEKKKIDDYIEKKSKLLNEKFFIEDQTMKQMNDLIKRAAEFIKKAVILKRPIIVRYDSDQDGLCAGLSFYFALKDYYNVKFIQQQFPYYSRLDFEDDKRYMDNLEAKHLPPVLITVDFGSNPESKEGYRLAVDNGFSIIVIDHHPPQDPSVGDLLDVWVNAWLLNSKLPSSYTAGMVACETARKINKINRELAEKLIKLSLTADRSRIYTPSKNDLKYAEAVGYFIGTSSYENNIVQYAKAITDEEMIDFAYAQSQEKIQNFIESATKFTKTKTVNGINFAFVNVTRLIKKGSYPNKGLAANIMADLLGNKDTPVITIVYTGRNISFRSNKAAIDAGLDISKAIFGLKEQMKQGIESGGGHKAAAALRVKPGYLKDALDKIVHLISSQIKK